MVVGAVCAGCGAFDKFFRVSCSPPRLTQEPTLFSTSIYENILYGREDAEKAWRRLLEAVVVSCVSVLAVGCWLAYA